MSKKYKFWEIELAQIASSSYPTFTLLEIYKTEKPSKEPDNIKVVNYGKVNNKAYTCYAVMINDNLIPLYEANYERHRDSLPLLEPTHKIIYDFGIYDGLLDTEECVCKHVSSLLNHLPLDCPHCNPENCHFSSVTAE